MARVTYGMTSPYGITPQASWHIGPYKHRRIAPAGDDHVVLIENHHQYRPDKLSQELYGTPSLWWVFMLRNMSTIRDPLNDFTVGKIIYAPSLGNLKKTLGI